MRRIQAINDTKIKYLSVANKIYEVTTINWLQSYLEARKTDLAVDDVPESELWDISFFKDFRIRLVNGGGMVGVMQWERLLILRSGWRGIRDDVINNLCLWLCGSQRHGSTNRIKKLLIILLICCLFIYYRKI